MSLPPHLAALRDEALQTSCEAWAIRCRWPLARGIDRAGPCPKCGGTDRFAIHTGKDTFLCRKCGISGQGVIELVKQTQDVGFTAACEIVTGRAADAPVDPARAERLRREAEAENDRRTRDANAYREKARRDGYALWQRAGRIDWNAGGVVAAYLRHRGIDPARILSRAPDALSCLRGIEMLEWREKLGADWVSVASAPAMIAAIQRADGRFAGAHRTWIDLEADKGRLVLPDTPDGKPRATKKVLGTQKGCAIRLYTPENPRRIVGGEGIETTLTVMCDAFAPETTYWAFVNVGNMGGKAARDARNKLVHDQPDMADAEAFVPPEWCAELVFLSDPESEGTRVHDRLTRGIRRAMRLRPGLRGWIAPPPADDEDFNDAGMRMARAQGVGA